MRMFQFGSFRRWRLVTALTAGVLIGTLLLTPAGAHVTSEFDHLWEKHIKPRFADPGTINDKDNPVDWTKLKSVPNSFADNYDHGQVLGQGLEFGGYKGAPWTQIDPNETQVRVKGACGNGKAIRKIGQSGDVTCSGLGGAGFTVTDANVGQICNDLCFAGPALPLPDGVYAIWANITLAQFENEGEMAVGCTLKAGGDEQKGFARVPTYSTGSIGQTSFATQAMALHMLAVLEEDGAATLACEDNEIGDVLGSNFRISAIRLSSLSDSTVR